MKREEEKKKKNAKLKSYYVTQAWPTFCGFVMCIFEFGTSPTSAKRFCTYEKKQKTNQKVKIKMKLESTESQIKSEYTRDRSKL